MSWADLLTLVGIAWAGAAHCAGMCGGFAMGAAAPGAGGRWWLRLGLYHLGKTFSYVCLGLLLLFGLEAWFSLGALRELQRILGTLMALFLLGLGVSYLTGWRWVGPWERALGRVGGCAAGLGLGAATPGRAVLIGWLNGLLPCGLTLTAVVFVLRFRRIEEVVLGLVVFGLATLPVLAFVVWLGTRLTWQRRQLWLRWGGWALVVGGLITLARTWPALHGGLPWTWWGGAGADPWCQ